jgi:hypothetical protein
MIGPNCTVCQVVFTSMARHAGRGLCVACWDRCKRHGSLIDYARNSRTRDDTLDDYSMLRSDGATVAQIAARLGMKLGSLQQLLRRSARAGDPRSDWSPPVRTQQGTCDQLRTKRLRAAQARKQAA